MSVASMIRAHGKTIAVERPSDARDEIGGRAPTYAPVATGLRAWVQPASVSTIGTYGRRDVRVTHSVFTSIDPEVREGDRLDVSGRKLSVRGVKNVAEADRLWRIDAEEIAS